MYTLQKENFQPQFCCNKSRAMQYIVALCKIRSLFKKLLFHMYWEEKKNETFLRDKIQK